VTFSEKLRQARNVSRVLSRRDALRLAFASRPGAAQAFASPTLGGPLYLRPGTVDDVVLEKVFLNHEYELPFALAPRRIVDAGAHIGLASRFFAHRHPQARIIAIEPAEANLAILRRNAEVCPQIEVRAGALWSRAAALVGSGEASWSHTMREAPDSRDTIRGITIPEILEHTGWDRIDLLKLDIEGAEREIFCDQAAAWLPRVRLIVIELHDRFQAGCSRAFYRQITDRLEAQEVRGENVFALLRE
jgi:FkbM family methyltransferase